MLSQSRKWKTSEPLSPKDRQDSDELVKKRSLKEQLDNSNTSMLRSCLTSAATPDILKQTPEVSRHTVAVQVDTCQQQTTHKSIADQELLAAYLRRNREFEACLVALQVFTQKVSFIISLIT